MYQNPDADKRLTFKITVCQMQRLIPLLPGTVRHIFGYYAPFPSLAGALTDNAAYPYYDIVL